GPLRRRCQGGLAPGSCHEARDADRLWGREAREGDGPAPCHPQGPGDHARRHDHFRGARARGARLAGHAHQRRGDGHRKVQGPQHNCQGKVDHLLGALRTTSSATARARRGRGSSVLRASRKYSFLGASSPAGFCQETLATSFPFFRISYSRPAGFPPTSRAPDEEANRRLGRFSRAPGAFKRSQGLPSTRTRYFRGEKNPPRAMSIWARPCELKRRTWVGEALKVGERKSLRPEGSSTTSGEGSVTAL